MAGALDVWASCAAMSGDGATLIGCRPSQAASKITASQAKQTVKRDQASSDVDRGRVPDEGLGLHHDAHLVSCLLSSHRSCNRKAMKNPIEVRDDVEEERTARRMTSWYCGKLLVSGSDVRELLGDRSCRRDSSAKVTSDGKLHWHSRRWWTGDL